MDRRSMPAEPIGDRTDRCSGVMLPEQRMTLLERLHIAIPSYPDGVALRT